MVHLPNRTTSPITLTLVVLPHSLVVAISANPDKKRDALALGAHEFVCLKDPILNHNATKLDYVLNTAANDPPWDYIIGLMETNGTLINLGVSPKGSMDIPHRPHLFKQRKPGS